MNAVLPPETAALPWANEHPGSAPRPVAAESRNGSPPPAADSRQRASQIQELLEKIGTLPDGVARDLFHECLQALLAFYGDGLGRILQLAGNAGAEGGQVLEALIRDELVRTLLLIHNLHPQSLETRLRAALDSVRPYLQSHGGNVELISLENDTARLRLQGTCQSCPSSAVTLELAVRQSLAEACPDLVGFEVEGVAGDSESRIPLGPEAPRWVVVDGFEPVAAGELRSLHVGGVPVVVCSVKGCLYAYRNRCAVCAARLDAGALDGGVLRCPSGHRFDVPRAGVCPEDPGVHLDPLPLIATHGIVKIAVK
jgi:Fe-S cluster biogenesis protein NfuA/nitrite reductase/ring-hydroxylating ferredoxin subunit